MDRRTELTFACRDFLLNILPNKVLSPCAIGHGVTNYTDLWVFAAELSELNRSAQHLLRFETATGNILLLMMKLMAELCVRFFVASSDDI